MHKKIAIISGVVGISAVLLLGWWLARRRITDRKLLLEAAADFREAATSQQRPVIWDVFCQQAAQGYYDDAMKTILLSNMDSEVQYSLVTLAQIRSKNGDAAGAIRTARAYSVAETREKAFQAIAVAQAERGDVQGARQSASLRANPLPALEAIGVVQADRGDLMGARETIASVPHPDSTLDAIGEYQNHSGDFQGALETAAQMSPASTANLLLDIGFELGNRKELGRVHALASHITDRELARDFVYYVRLSQSTLEHVLVVQANACDLAYSDAQKGEFDLAYQRMAGTKCSHAEIAIRQYDSDPAGAEKALHMSSDPEDMCFGLASFAEAASKRDIAEALRLVGAAENACGAKYWYRLGVVRPVARQWTIKEGRRNAVKWARLRSSAWERGDALLGVAEALGHPHP